MPERLSNLNESQLRYLLFRVKEVASMTDDSALAGADKMLYEFQELNSLNESKNLMSVEGLTEEDYFLEGYGDEDVERQLRDFGQKLSDVEKLLKKNVKVSKWKFQRLPNQAGKIDQFWTKKIRDEKAKDVAMLRLEAQRLSDLGEFMSWLRVIEEMLEFPLSNIASVQRVVKELRESGSYLANNNLLTDELKAKIVKGKVRAAWYRSKKKLAEAEVAATVGSLSRVARLSKEAVALLSQDWESIFPGETVPALESESAFT